MVLKQFQVYQKKNSFFNKMSRFLRSWSLANQCRTVAASRFVRGSACGPNSCTIRWLVLHYTEKMNRALCNSQKKKRERKRKDEQSEYIG